MNKQYFPDSLESPCLETWDSKRWLACFDGARDKREHRALRKDVFRHTVACVQAGYYYTEKGEKQILPDPSAMIKNTFFADRPLSVTPKLHCDEEIEVWNQDTLTAAKQLVDAGYHPAVLNMANRHTPGGGVHWGAGAQEENLFRRTNLFLSLYQFSSHAAEYGTTSSETQYPMDRNYGGIYSPSVAVFRGEEKEGYPLLAEPYFVDVISVAGINGPELDPAGRLSSNDTDTLKNKIRTILMLGMRGGNDALVLGALGCGAFCNPPEHVAEIFHCVMLEEAFDGAFKKIVFAIRERHAVNRLGKTAANYEVFRKEFEEK